MGVHPLKPGRYQASLDNMILLWKIFLATLLNSLNVPSLMSIWAPTCHTISATHGPWTFSMGGRESVSKQTRSIMNGQLQRAHASCCELQEGVPKSQLPSSNSQVSLEASGSSWSSITAWDGLKKEPQRKPQSEVQK